MVVFIHNHKKLETTQMSLGWWKARQTGISWTRTLFSNKKEPTTTWMNLKCILISERSHMQKATYVWFHLYDVWKDKIISTEERSVAGRDWGVGGDWLQ